MYLVANTKWPKNTLKLKEHDFSDSIEATLTTSRYGKPVLLLGSYRYNKSPKYRGSRVMWYCSRNRQGCKASVLTLDQVIVRMNGHHKHNWCIIVPYIIERFIYWNILKYFSVFLCFVLVICIFWFTFFCCLC